MASSWKVVYNLEAGAFQADRVRERRELCSKMKHTRGVLDGQVRERADAREALRQEELELARKIRQDARSRRMAEKLFKARKRAEDKRQVDERLRTERELENLRAKRHERKISMELEATQKCKEAIEKERQRQLTKKKQAQKVNERLLLENKVRLEAKERARQEQMKEEIRMNKAYEKSLAQKDKEREDFLAKQQQKQKKLLERSLNYYAENVREKELEDARKAKIVQEEHERREKQKHKEVLERQARQRQLIKEQIEGQIMRNKATAEERRLEGIRIAQEQKEAYAKSIREALDKEKSDRLARINYQQELLQQAESDRQRRQYNRQYGNIVMSSFEEGFNQELLKANPEELPPERNILRVVG